MVTTFTDKDFKKSTHSPLNFWVGKCVEVAIKDGSIAVRDSKNPNGGMLVFDDGEWDAFIKGVKDGEFDL